METQPLSIRAEQDNVIEEFSQFTDWADRYEYLIYL
jgi:sulfur transfer protein SufE